MWSSSVLGEVNFQLTERGAGAQALFTDLVVVNPACFMEGDRSVKQCVSETKARPICPWPSTHIFFVSYFLLLFSALTSFAQELLTGALGFLTTDTLSVSGSLLRSYKNKGRRQQRQR